MAAEVFDVDRIATLSSIHSKSADLLVEYSSSAKLLISTIGVATQSFSSTNVAKPIVSFTLGLHEEN